MRSARGPGIRARRPGIMVLCALFPVLVGATTPVRVELDPLEITVGDPIQAELTLVWDGEAPTGMPRFPDWSTQTWGAAEVLNVGEVEAVSDRGGRYIYSLGLTLTAFETGEVELPSLMVTVPLAEGSARVPIREGARFEVQSVLPKSEDGSEAVAEDLEPRPEAPLRALPGEAKFLWTAGSLVALCLLAAVDLRRRLGRVAVSAQAAEAAVPLAPLEELLVHLKNIAFLKTTDAKACEQAHTALSLALRRFLGRSLDFNALESTTREIEHRLGRETLLAEGLRVEVTDLLAACDRVKYAHLAVAGAEVESRLQSTERWAHRVDSELRPPQPDEDGEASQ